MSDQTAGELREQVRSRYPEAGFADPAVTFTTQAARGLHSAIIRAARPAG